MEDQLCGFWQALKRGPGLGGVFVVGGRFKRLSSEQCAANVMVLLDGWFATNIDAQGRFEFAYVTVGNRVLSVVSDNLPLPWGLKQDGRTEVCVFTHETTTVDVAAVRQ